MFLTIDDPNNHVPVFHEFEILSQEVYDAKYGTGNLPANAKAISGDSGAADSLEAACDGSGYNLGAGQIVAASVTSKTGYELVPAYDGQNRQHHRSLLMLLMQFSTICRYPGHKDGRRC